MRWVLIGYMFLFIHRPFEIWPILGDLHVERVYMCCALVALLVCPDKHWLPNRLHWAYFGFGAAVLICWLLSPWMDQGEMMAEHYFKVLVFYVMFMSLVHDEKGLRHLMLGFLGVMTVYMLHSLLEYFHGRFVYRMNISRLIGVDVAMSDPNTFGATIAYALPFIVPFWVSGSSGKLHWFLTFYIALSVVCVGLTGSRSAMMGLLLWAVITALRSRWRWGLLLLMVLAAPVLFAALPAELQNRFTNIFDPSRLTRSEIESGMGRVNGFLKGMALWGQYPLTGCGPGVFRPAAHSKIETHNLYGQLAGEMGTLGILAFIAILLGIWGNSAVSAGSVVFTPSGTTISQSRSPRPSARRCSCFSSKASAVTICFATAGCGTAVS